MYANSRGNSGSQESQRRLSKLALQVFLCPNSHRDWGLLLTWSSSNSVPVSCQFGSRSAWCPSAIWHDLLPVTWGPTGAPALKVLAGMYQYHLVALGVGSKWCPSIIMHDLLPASWAPSNDTPSCAPALGLKHLRSISGVLRSKWRPGAKG